MAPNLVQWSEVDYGGGAFHVASYKRPEAAVRTAPEAASELRRCLPLEAFLRCWTGRAACEAAR